jgi:Tol biopolymer transport system component
VPRGGGRVTFVGLGDAPNEAYAEVSPDGQKIAFVRIDPDGERIYVAPAGGGKAKQLTASRGTLPRWSRDSQSIVFATTRAYDGNIVVVGADGTGERTVVSGGGWPAWFPNGREIGYLAVGPTGNQEIRVVPAAGGQPRVLESIRLTGTNLPFAIFPDGQRIVVPTSVHVSDEIWLIEPKR